MTKNLHVPYQPQPEPFETDYDYMVAAILDGIADDIPPEAVESLCVLAENAKQFWVGMQATVILWEIVDDHYAPIEEPDDGAFEEADEILSRGGRRHWRDPEDDDEDDL